MSDANRLKSLDLLRGLAIFGVLAFHTFGIFNTELEPLQRVSAQGYLGVQLFFVVSSLTMCLMWDRRRNEVNQTSKFYIRRIFRIAPPFWIAMLAYTMLHGTQISDWAPDGLGPKQFLATATFSHTLFPDTVNAVVPGGWSIGVEMIFYLFFPLLIRLGKSPSVYLSLALATWLINTLVVRPLYGEVYSQTHDRLLSEFLYFQFFSQAPVFLAGIALYQLLFGKSGSFAWSLAIAGAWLVSAFASRYWFGLVGMPYFWLAVLAILATCAVILQFNLSWQPMNFLGEISYSVYLAHFAIIDAVSLLSNRIGMPVRGFGAIVTFALVLLASLVLGALSRATIERWSSNFGSWLIKRTQIGPAGENEC
jgi:peptidoglycan/LPS O-acetylase OafA/YrhL